MARTLVEYTKGIWELGRGFRETEKGVGLETGTKTKMSPQEILSIAN